MSLGGILREFLPDADIVYIRGNYRVSVQTEASLAQLSAAQAKFRNATGRPWLLTLAEQKPGSPNNHANFV